MIVSDVTTRVLKQFGDEASAQINGDDIIRWINDGIREIAVKNSLSQASALQNVVAGTATYTFPTDMLSMQTLYFDGLRIPFLKRQEYDQYVNSSDPKEELTGTPTLWTRWGRQFTLYPEPDTSITNGIKILYIQTPTAVDDPTDALPFPTEYHNRIVEYVLQQAYEVDEDWDASSQKKDQLSEGLDILKYQEEHVERETYPTITVLADDM